MATTKTNNAAREELLRRVKVRVPRRSGDKEPLVLRVGDYCAIIQRGASVEIPYYAALALQESLDADERTALQLEELQSRYEAASMAN